jgi:hypothetical protein
MLVKLRANEIASVSSSACPRLPSQTHTIQDFAENQATELAPAIAIPADEMSSLDCLAKISEYLVTSIQTLVKSNNERKLAIDSQSKMIENLETRVGEQQEVLAALKEEMAELKAARD